MPTRHPVAGDGKVVVACLIMRITTRAESWTSLMGESAAGIVAMMGGCRRGSGCRSGIGCRSFSGSVVGVVCKAVLLDSSHQLCGLRHVRLTNSMHVRRDERKCSVMPSAICHPTFAFAFAFVPSPFHSIHSTWRGLLLPQLVDLHLLASVGSRSYDSDRLSIMIPPFLRSLSAHRMTLRGCSEQ